jgi:hypothetical protein
MNKPFKVKLKRGTSEKTIAVYAESVTNATYVAEKQNPGFKAIDVQRG